MLWVSVCDERDELSKFQQAIEKASDQIIASVKEERFTAHLTVGRAKNLHLSHARKLTDVAAGFEGKVFGGWRAEAVELMRSELGASGSVYTRLEVIPLGGNI